MKQSNFLSLNWRDFLRGLLMAVLTPVFTTAYDSFSRGEFVLNWHLIALSAIGGAGAYLSKNLFTKADTVQTLSNDIVGDHPPKDGGR